jgi:hypothetical protein
MQLPDHITVGHEGVIVRGMNQAIQRFLQQAPHMTAEYIWLRHLPDAGTSDAIFTSHYAAIRFFAWCRQQRIGEDSMNKRLILHCLENLVQSGATNRVAEIRKVRTLEELMGQDVWQDSASLWDPVRQSISRYE